MHAITKKIWSHLSIDKAYKNSNREVRQGKPWEVNSYRELVELIARISYNNPYFSLFYRGQDEDYTKKKGLSVVYPSFFRRHPGNITLDKITTKLEKS